jgi:RNA polymerase sigma factor (sigma-70 family)
MGTEEGNTTASIQHHLDKLGAESHDSESVRVLLERSATRLSMLCGNLLHRRYPRLTHPPLNLSSDELLSVVVERLIKAMREAKPNGVRQYFALASQHMRWELNDLARRLDSERHSVTMDEALIAAFEPSDSQLSDLCKQIFAEIDGLPAEQREVFELVRIQGLPVSEVAKILNVTEVTVRRRLSRALSGLTTLLDDRSPNSQPSGNSGN